MLPLVFGCEPKINDSPDLFLHAKKKNIRIKSKLRFRGVVLRLPHFRSKLNWNWYVFRRGENPDYPKRNLSEQTGDLTTSQSTYGVGAGHIDRRCFPYCGTTSPPLLPYSKLLNSFLWKLTILPSFIYSCPRIITSHVYPYQWESNSCKGILNGYFIIRNSCHRGNNTYSP